MYLGIDRRLACQFFLMTSNFEHQDLSESPHQGHINELGRSTPSFGELHLFSKVNVWVVSDLQMGDFVVETEVKIPLDYKGFNSGLGFRLIGDKGKPKGYQCEIDRGKPAGVYGIGMGGWLFPKGAEQTAAYQKASKGLFKPKEWNHFRVEAKGPRIRTWLNGKLIAELKHQQSLKGRFGIQHHGKGSTVKFRHLRARELK